MLAGTQSLGKREMSPLSKLKQTRGIATTKRVDDNFEIRNKLAQKEYKTQSAWKSHKDHVFRDTDPGSVLAFNQVDFKLIEKPPLLENPGHMSVHDTRPRFWSDRERLLSQR